MDESLTAKTLQDIPIEIQELILMEAISSEVRDSKLFRSGWRKAADRVIERLGKVCLRWNNALESDVFLKRLYQLLDSYGEVKLTVNILGVQIFSDCVNVTTLDSGIFVLSHQPQQIVRILGFDRNDLATVRRIIPLPGVFIPYDLVGCSLSNCLYVLHQTLSGGIEIWRVLMGNGDEFEVSPWITCERQFLSRISVSREGNLVLYQGLVPSTIKVFSSDRTLMHQVVFEKPISYLQGVMTTSNGNLVLVKMQTLTEVDREGRTVREYIHGRCSDQIHCAIDPYDRVLIINECGNVRMADSEYNSVELKGYLQSYHSKRYSCRLHYDATRDEFLAFENATYADTADGQSVTIFNITEESVASVEGDACAEDYEEME